MPTSFDDLKILVVHPGASWSTQDVYAGLRFGLSYHGVKTAVFQLDVRIARSSEWLNFVWQRSNLPASECPSPRDIQFHAANNLLIKTLQMEPDWVFIVSGMYLDVDIMKYLKKIGTKTALLLTESPYDDDAQVEVVPHVDVVFTNERSSVARLSEYNPRTHYLAHAWHPAVHDMPPIDLALPAHDVLFIGTGFDERKAFLGAVPWGQPASGQAELSLYGHWTELDDYATLKSAIRGETVQNVLATRLYQRARININLHRTSKGATADGSEHIVHAESLNPRCYEMAACGAFFVSDQRAELVDVFGPDVIPTFDSPETLTEVIRTWRNTPMARQEVINEARERIMPHNWVARAEQALSVLTAV